MDKVIKHYDNDQEWYLLSGKFSGDDVFTPLYIRTARENGVRLSTASEEERARIENIALEKLRAWDEENQQGRLPFPEFRKEVLTELKDLGDAAFIDNASIIQRISDYFDRYYFREALYLVALMETLYAEQNRRRKRIFPALHDCKLEEPLSAVSSTEPLDLSAGLPRFAERNIYEPDIRAI